MLDSFFKPKSIAVIGASRDKNKIGYGVIHNLKTSGFRGRIYPINPKAKAIDGLKVYPSVTKISKQIDIAVIVVPAKIVFATLEECGKMKIPFAVIISSGFKEVGQKGLVNEQKIVSVAKKHNIRILGPNCLGLVNTEHRLNASFAGQYPKPGKISFVSQSGAIAVSLIDWSLSNHVGINKLVSLGNKSDLNELDMLEYLSEDDDTAVIGMYLEQISEPLRFMHLVSKVTKKKPVIILKAGSSEQGKHAVQSHTGSLASSHKITSAAFKQAGAVEVNDLEDLFKSLELFSEIKSVNKHITVLSNAGGPAIIAVDTISNSEHLKLTSISENTTRRLKRALPATASLQNPIDIVGDADMTRFKKALDILVDSDEVKTLYVIVTPQTVTPINKLAEYIAGLNIKSKATIIASFIGGEKVESARMILKKKNVLHFAYPHDGLRVLNIAQEYNHRHQLFLYKEQSYTNSDDKKFLSYKKTQQVLKDKFPIVFGSVINSESALKRIKKFPVAMKALSSLLIHKKAAGAISLGIRNQESAIEQYSEFKKSFSRKKLEGVLVQPMMPDGFECILGAKRDRDFGFVIMVGVGGSSVEILKDISIRVAPVSEYDALLMLKELRSYNEVRKYDTKFLVKQIVNTSNFVLRRPNIVELDFNPITIYKKGGKILDARIFTI